MTFNQKHKKSTTQTLLENFGIEYATSTAKCVGDK